MVYEKVGEIAMHGESGQASKEDGTATLYVLLAYDSEGGQLPVFSPIYQGTFQEAFAWFNGMDFIQSNPHIDKLVIQRMDDDR